MVKNGVFLSLVYMHHMVVMTVRAKDLDVDVPVLVNLPIRCMWGGQPDRWFVWGWVGLPT